MIIDESIAQKKQEIKPNIFKIEELNASQIDALDRDKTLFFLPIGTLEQHGSHLPIGTDSFVTNFYVDELAKRIGKSYPDRTIVLMPTLNYSNGGANEIGDILVHPGTYGIRQKTLRAAVADIGGQIAQNGFKWIFVLHAHGSPNHNLAINDASDFISEEYNVTMLNLDSMASEDSANNAAKRKIKQKYFTSQELNSIGWDIHAGTKETSLMLAIKPELVDKNYKKLPDLSGSSEEAILKIAKSKNWTGYFASPARANANFGKEMLDANLETFSSYIERALKGENLFDLPRFPVEKKEFGKTEDDWKAHEKTLEKKFENWLKKKKRIE
jgi:creatinine amidohydrolase/Fe(II)-dependent formamide hydrolase-like protein